MNDDACYDETECLGVKSLKLYQSSLWYSLGLIWKKWQVCWVLISQSWSITYVIDEVLVFAEEGNLFFNTGSASWHHNFTSSSVKKFSQFGFGVLHLSSSLYWFYINKWVIVILGRWTCRIRSLFWVIKAWMNLFYQSSLWYSTSSLGIITLVSIYINITLLLVCFLIVDGKTINSSWKASKSFCSFIVVIRH